MHSTMIAMADLDWKGALRRTNPFLSLSRPSLVLSLVARSLFLSSTRCGGCTLVGFPAGSRHCLSLTLSRVSAVALIVSLDISFLGCFEVEVNLAL